MIKAATSIVITTADPVALISYQITGQVVLVADKNKNPS